MLSPKQEFMDFFAQPISLASRLLLLLAVAAVFFVFQYPLWTMSFRSNQYTDPLRLAIHIDHLEGQHTPERDDLREINSLNHYIGMRPLLESDFAEFVWLPFVVGAIALLALRVFVFGRIRDLIDLFVLYIYFGMFSAWAFYNKLYAYGHNLDPQAAIKVEGFTPPFFGEVKIANFWVESYPAGASLALAIVGACIGLSLLIALIRGWRKYREAKLSIAASPQS